MPCPCLQYFLVPSLVASFLPCHVLVYNTFLFLPLLLHSFHAMSLFTILSCSFPCCFIPSMPCPCLQYFLVPSLVASFLPCHVLVYNTFLFLPLLLHSFHATSLFTILSCSFPCCFIPSMPRPCLPYFLVPSLVASFLPCHVLVYNTFLFLPLLLHSFHAVSLFTILSCSFPCCFIPSISCPCLQYFLVPSLVASFLPCHVLVYNTFLFLPLLLHSFHVMSLFTILSCSFPCCFIPSMPCPCLQYFLVPSLVASFLPCHVLVYNTFLFLPLLLHSFHAMSLFTILSCSFPCCFIPSMPPLSLFTILSCSFPCCFIPSMSCPCLQYFLVPSLVASFLPCHVLVYNTFLFLPLLLHSFHDMSLFTILSCSFPCCFIPSMSCPCLQYFLVPSLVASFLPCHVLVYNTFLFLPLLLHSFHVMSLFTILSCSFPCCFIPSMSCPCLQYFLVPSLVASFLPCHVLVYNTLLFLPLLLHSFHAMSLFTILSCSFPCCFIPSMPCPCLQYFLVPSLVASFLPCHVLVYNTFLFLPLLLHSFHAMSLFTILSCSFPCCFIPSMSCPCLQYFLVPSLVASFLPCHVLVYNTFLFLPLLLHSFHAMSLFTILSCSFPCCFIPSMPCPCLQYFLVPSLVASFLPCHVLVYNTFLFLPLLLHSFHVMSLFTILSCSFPCCFIPSMSCPCLQYFLVPSLVASFLPCHVLVYNTFLFLPLLLHSFHVMSLFTILSCSFPCCFIPSMPCPCLQYFLVPSLVASFLPCHVLVYNTFLFLPLLLHSFHVMSLFTILSCSFPCCFIPSMSCPCLQYSLVPSLVASFLPCHVLVYNTFLFLPLLLHSFHAMSLFTILSCSFPCCFIPSMPCPCLQYFLVPSLVASFLPCHVLVYNTFLFLPLLLHSFHVMSLFTILSCSFPCCFIPSMSCPCLQYSLVPSLVASFLPCHVLVYNTFLFLPLLLHSFHAMSLFTILSCSFPCCFIPSMSCPCLQYFLVPSLVASFLPCHVLVYNTFLFLPLLLHSFHAMSLFTILSCSFPCCFIPSMSCPCLQYFLVPSLVASFLPCHVLVYNTFLFLPLLLHSFHAMSLFTILSCSFHCCFIPSMPCPCLQYFLVPSLVASFLPCHVLVYNTFLFLPLLLHSFHAMSLFTILSSSFPCCFIPSMSCPCLPYFLVPSLVASFLPCHVLVYNTFLFLPLLLHSFHAMSLFTILSCSFPCCFIPSMSCPCLQYFLVPSLVASFLPCHVLVYNTFLFLPLLLHSFHVMSLFTILSCSFPCCFIPSMPCPCLQYFLVPSLVASFLPCHVLVYNTFLFLPLLLHSFHAMSLFTILSCSFPCCFIPSMPCPCLQYFLVPSLVASFLPCHVLVYNTFLFLPLLLHSFHAMSLFTILSCSFPCCFIPSMSCPCLQYFLVPSLVASFLPCHVLVYNTFLFLPLLLHSFHAMSLFTILSCSFPCCFIPSISCPCLPYFLVPSLVASFLPCHVLVYNTFLFLPLLLHSFHVMSLFTILSCSFPCCFIPSMPCPCLQYFLVPSLVASFLPCHVLVYNTFLFLPLLLHSFHAMSLFTILSCSFPCCFIPSMPCPCLQYFLVPSLVASFLPCHVLVYNTFLFLPLLLHSFHAMSLFTILSCSFPCCFIPSMSCPCLQYFLVPSLVASFLPCHVLVYNTFLFLPLLLHSFHAMSLFTILSCSFPCCFIPSMPCPCLQYFLVPSLVASFLPCHVLVYNTFLFLPLLLHSFHVMSLFTILSCSFPCCFIPSMPCPCLQYFLVPSLVASFLPCQVLVYNTFLFLPLLLHSFHAMSLFTILSCSFPCCFIPSMPCPCLQYSLVPSLVASFLPCHVLVYNTFLFLPLLLHSFHVMSLFTILSCSFPCCFIPSMSCPCLQYFLVPSLVASFLSCPCLQYFLVPSLVASFLPCHVLVYNTFLFLPLLLHSFHVMSLFTILSCSFPCCFIPSMPCPCLQYFLVPSLVASFLPCHVLVYNTFLFLPLLLHSFHAMSLFTILSCSFPCCFIPSMSCPCLQYSLVLPLLLHSFHVMSLFTILSCSFPCCFIPSMPCPCLQYSLVPSLVASFLPCHVLVYNTFLFLPLLLHSFHVMSLFTILSCSFPCCFIPSMSCPCLQYFLVPSLVASFLPCHVLVYNTLLFLPLLLHSFHVMSLFTILSCSFPCCFIPSMPCPCLQYSLVPSLVASFLPCHVLVYNTFLFLPLLLHSFHAMSLFTILSCSFPCCFIPSMPCPCLQYFLVPSLVASFLPCHVLVYNTFLFLPLLLHSFHVMSLFTILSCSFPCCFIPSMPCPCLQYFLVPSLVASFLPCHVLVYNTFLFLPLLLHSFHIMSLFTILSCSFPCCFIPSMPCPCLQYFLLPSLVASFLPCHVLVYNTFLFLPLLLHSFHVMSLFTILSCSFPCCFIPSMPCPCLQYFLVPSLVASFLPCHVLVYNTFLFLPLLLHSFHVMSLFTILSCSFPCCFIPSMSCPCLQYFLVPSLVASFLPCHVLVYNTFLFLPLLLHSFHVMSLFTILSCSFPCCFIPSMPCPCLQYFLVPSLVAPFLPCHVLVYNTFLFLPLLLHSFHVMSLFTILSCSFHCCFIPSMPCPCLQYFLVPSLVASFLPCHVLVYNTFLFLPLLLHSFHVMSLFTILSCSFPCCFIPSMPCPCLQYFLVPSLVASFLPYHVLVYHTFLFLPLLLHSFHVMSLFTILSCSFPCCFIPSMSCPCLQYFLVPSLVASFLPCHVLVYNTFLFLPLLLHSFHVMSLFTILSCSFPCCFIPSMPCPCLQYFLVPSLVASFLPCHVLVYNTFLFLPLLLHSFHVMSLFTILSCSFPCCFIPSMSCPCLQYSLVPSLVASFLPCHVLVYNTFLFLPLLLHSFHVMSLFTILSCSFHCCFIPSMSCSCLQYSLVPSLVASFLPCHVLVYNTLLFLPLLLHSFHVMSLFTILSCSFPCCFIPSMSCPCLQYFLVPSLVASFLPCHVLVYNTFLFLPLLLHSFHVMSLFTILSCSFPCCFIPSMSCPCLQYFLVPSLVASFLPCHVLVYHTFLFLPLLLHSFHVMSLFTILSCSFPCCFIPSMSCPCLQYFLVPSLVASFLPCHVLVYNTFLFLPLLLHSFHVMSLFTILSCSFPCCFIPSMPCPCLPYFLVPSLVASFLPCHVLVYNTLLFLPLLLHSFHVMSLFTILSCSFPCCFIPSMSCPCLQYFLVPSLVASFLPCHVLVYNTFLFLPLLLHSFHVMSLFTILSCSFPCCFIPSMPCPCLQYFLVPSLVASFLPCHVLVYNTFLFLPLLLHSFHVMSLFTILSCSFPCCFIPSMPCPCLQYFLVPSLVASFLPCHVLVYNTFLFLPLLLHSFHAMSLFTILSCSFPCCFIPSMPCPCLQYSLVPSLVASFLPYHVLVYNTFLFLPLLLHSFHAMSLFTILSCSFPCCFILTLLT